MKELYYQFVNYIQGLSNLWFATIWLGIMCIIFVLVVKFYKIYNGTQKNFEKVSLLVLALVLFAVLIFLTTIRT